MTRQEFEENVTTFWELLDWCGETGCYLYDEVVSEESYNSWINEDMDSRIRDGASWQDMLDWLNELPSGYDYYRYSEYSSEWCGLTDYDFDSIWNEALEWGDENNAWDEDEESEEQTEEEEEEGESIDLPDLDGFMLEASDTVLTFRRRTAEERAAQEALERAAAAAFTAAG